MDSQYVVQRTNVETSQVDYLSPGKVNWVTEADHKKFRTRYGKWVWGEAEQISAYYNKKHALGYTYVPLPARNHL